MRNKAEKIVFLKAERPSLESASFLVQLFTFSNGTFRKFQTCPLSNNFSTCDKKK